MHLPLPGSPVRGSKSGRPIMVLLDMLGRRTALRVLWELRDGSLTFRALQAAAETNPSVLNTRIGELRRANIIELTPDGYRLTARGHALAEVLIPLSRWADEWSKSLPATSGDGS